MPNLDRQADCPSCGATVTFKFAGARSVVCDYCHSVVARTDFGLQATGRMAELLEIPSPLSYGVTGTWHNDAFEVIGRVQMDRAGEAGAPWQEILLWFSMHDKTCWVANAQGRWYTSEEVPMQGPVPSFTSLRPGAQVDLLGHGLYVVSEVAQRRVISGEGSLPNVPKPGIVTRYADLSGPRGAFGTIDYGDGLEQPVVYLGSQFDPKELKLDSGIPVEAPTAAVGACECPNCGASLPLTSERTERIVCQYCGTKSDITSGHLQALGPAPRPPIQPYIPLGSRGNLRGVDYVVCGFVIRSCRVEGQQYPWREYLLFGGDSVGYKWLMEEDGKWSFVDPVEAGMVGDSGNVVSFNGASYALQQTVRASVDYVLGEFYWKVEIGETVDARDFTGPGGKVSKEQSSTEVNYSFVSPLNPQELTAFGVAAPSSFTMPNFDFGSSSGGSGSSSNALGTIVLLVFLCIVIGAMDECGDGSSGGFYGGGSFSK